MNTPAAKAKAYVKEHAPEIITAIAAVAVVGLIIKTRKDVRGLVNAYANDVRQMQIAIPEMIKMDRPFTYYPGIAAFWDEIPSDVNL